MAPNIENRSDPISKLYGPIEKADIVSDGLFYVCAALSIAALFLDKASYPEAYNWLMIIFAVSVITLFIVGLLIRLHLSPRADDARRKGFLESACNIPLAPESTVGYYNNNELKSPERIAAQVLENSHFTKSGVMSLLKCERTKVAVYSLIWFVCVLNRQFDLGWIVVASQTVFSEQILSKWLRLEWLRIRTEEIFDAAFQLHQTRPKANTFNARAIELFTRYESSKANAGITLSSKVFFENNKKWSGEWESIKVKLNIK
jgi:hypothetical protein